MKPKRIYLDYAASTPVAPEVLKAMAPYWSDKFGNPSSVHSFGQEALSAVDRARETVTKAIMRPPAGEFREIIFTGSATEANNLALWGTLLGARNFMKGLPKIIVSSIEHESVLQTARDMESAGEIELAILPVDRNGIVDVKKIEKELNERTILVSVMYVNNEIGSVQPIAEISKIVATYKSGKSYPLFHTDAAQAFNYFNCDVNELGVDLMTLSGQKIYGPKGIGALYARNQKQKTYNLKPIITGGGQEFGLRSGTENVPLIVGFAKAVELAEKCRKESAKKVLGLRNYFWKGLKKFYPGAEINGDSKTLHILNIYFPTEFAGDLLVKLDIAGIAVSAGSACTARAYTPSYVLQALNLSPERVRGSLRFSFGKNNTKQELDAAFKIMNKILS
ncbi:MAG: cysteine desulfurase family protein [Minisyncoccia bacterium]